MANELANQVPDRLEKKKKSVNILQGDLENRNMNGSFRMDHNVEIYIS